LAIFWADFLHNQFRNNYGRLYLINFIEGYMGKNYLSDDKLNFSLTLGGVDVVFDHISPRVGEKNLSQIYCLKILQRKRLTSY